jgi:deoxyribonuclease IV
MGHAVKEPVRAARDAGPGKGASSRAAATWHPYLGAHMSIAGGHHHALEAAARYRSRAVQLFTRNSNQWAAKPLEPESVRLFRETDQRLGPFEMAAHDSYLINLGSPDVALRRKSLGAFVEEITRCEELGIPRLVFHPGSHMGAGEAAGLAAIADSVRQAIRATAGSRVRLLIENTAGQGTNLGYRLEHLQELLERIGIPERTGVCLDTCHLLAAGYDFRTAEGYARVRGDVDARIGHAAVGWFHLNDSRCEVAGRVDRHAHIGKGCIGVAPFRFILTDPAFRNVPMVLETPKEGEADRRNLALLRRLSRVEHG